MNQFFLNLEIDRFGITAMTLEQGLNEILIKEQCKVLYKDLQETDNIFYAGLELISKTINIQGCLHAVVLVSPSMISFINVTLPFKSPKKISQVLRFELENMLVFSDKNFISDFHFLSTGLDENLIFTASIKESIIETYVSGLKKLDIKPLIIAPNGYAASLSLMDINQDISSFIYVYLREYESILVIVVDKKPCVVRSFHSKSTPEQLAVNIKQTVIGFSQKTGVNLTLDIFIACQDNEQYAHKLEKALEIELKKIKVIDLLSSIYEHKKHKCFINFCKGKYEAFSFFKEYSKKIVIACSIAMAVFILYFISMQMDINRLENRVLKIDNKMVSIFKQTFPLTKKIQDPYLELKANVLFAMKKQNNLTKKKDQSITVLDVLFNLSKKIPASINLDISRLLFNDSRLILSGSTDNFNSVDKIKNSLEDKNLFTKINISSAALDKKSDKINFKFIIEL